MQSGLKIALIAVALAAISLALAALTILDPGRTRTSSPLGLAAIPGSNYSAC